MEDSWGLNLSLSVVLGFGGIKGSVLWGGTDPSELAKAVRQTTWPGGIGKVSFLGLLIIRIRQRVEVVFSLAA